MWKNGEIHPIRCGVECKADSNKDVNEEGACRLIASCLSVVVFAGYAIGLAHMTGSAPKVILAHCCVVVLSPDNCNL